MARSSERVIVPQPVGHFCFACGTANPIGLKLSFYRQGNLVATDIILQREHMGWEGIAHGGILSTLLDEVMAWAVIVFRQTFFVTKRMEIRYHRPVRLGIPLTVRAEIAPDQVHQGCRTHGTIFDGRETALASAEADMVYLSSDKQALIPEHVRADMERIFAEIRKMR